MALPAFALRYLKYLKKLKTLFRPISHCLDSPGQASHIAQGHEANYDRCSRIPRH